MAVNFDQILEENQRRLSVFTQTYNPYTGEGSTTFPRMYVYVKGLAFEEQWIPKDMWDNEPFVRQVVATGSIKAYIERVLGEDPDNQFVIDEIDKTFIRTRIKYDFEFWAAMTVHIEDKVTAQDVPFILRVAQRILLKDFEDQRRANKPIREIVLKARQWGSSTFCQIYIAWIQLVHKTKWHSVICAHLKDTASTIKGMYTKLINNYPSWLVDQTTDLKFIPFEKTTNISIINGFGTKVTIGSAEAPESVRGSNAYCAHYSEVAFYPNTISNSPQRLIRSSSGGILNVPLTVIIYESTADGAGTFFHTEWLRAKSGKSDKKPLFVAWFMIELYMQKVDDYHSLIESLDDYEWNLWRKGATLEGIAWYREKLKMFDNHEDMKAEFPSDDVEAFTHSGTRVFPTRYTEALREDCEDPVYRGEFNGKEIFGRDCLKELTFVEGDGNLMIWKQPDTRRWANRYIVIVDIGGRTKRADNSVITVMDRMPLFNNGKLEVVARWVGHIDHDLLAWKAVQIASAYSRALLVIESNTLEKDRDTDGDQSEYILEMIAEVYSNLYFRSDGDKIKEQLPMRWGFHTNKRTKPMIIGHLIAAMREETFMEKEHEAVNECEWYEKKENGSYGAIDGKHDDRVMTDAIGVYVSNQLPPPKIVSADKMKRKKRIKNFSDI